MCYDGALVMPKNYAVVNEEEMTYVDGGWDISTTVRKNSWGIIKGVDVYFTGTVADMAWLVTGAAAAALGLGALLTGIPVVGPIFAAKAYSATCILIGLAATVVATNDRACNKRFTINTYIGL